MTSRHLLHQSYHETPQQRHPNGHITDIAMNARAGESAFPVDAARILRPCCDPEMIAADEFRAGACRAATSAMPE
jgi:hypothetical protein